MRIAGTDPGKTGICICLDTDTSQGFIHKFQYNDDNGLDLGRWFAFIQQTDPQLIFLERVSGHAKSGSWSPSTLFKLGFSAGQINAAVAMTGKPFRLVSPQKWQKFIHVGIEGESAKDKSMTAYRQFAPHNPIPQKGKNPNHNIVDAFLIAMFGILNTPNGENRKWDLKIVK